ncbi:MAG: tetratricopeptide repeat protein [Bacteroidetes bacterium]|nr:MAG: tetratricopeptide repeat protein [Bacteroidota bacterium]
MSKPIFYLLLLFIAGSGCMSSTSLEVLQPAAFALPAHISTIATVNRTRPANRVGNVLEGLITGEDIGQDRSGARRATEGLSDALTRTPRFNVVFTGIEMKGKGALGFPDPLPWSTIDSICQRYGSDAVATIEKFDSDIGYQTSSRQRTRKDKEGNETTYTEYNVDMHTRVTMGWRLYDPTQQRILDEIEVTEQMGWDRTGTSESQARNALPDARSTVDEVAYLNGQQYGMRIAPTWVRVRRQYYAKAKAKENPQIAVDMAEATRFAKVDRWAEAARLWRPIAEDRRYPKAAGRAAYNMALASEWEGKLDLAIEWADKAYTQYGNGQARSYASLLRQRQRDQDRLREQMND